LTTKVMVLVVNIAYGRLPVKGLCSWVTAKGALA
jgi:hypothetical protein